MKKVFLIMIIGLTVSSCKYSRPIISIQTAHKTTFDSLTQTRKTSKEAIYFSLRRFSIIGYYKIEREDSLTGTLTKLTISKGVPMYRKRGHDYFSRFTTITKYYDSKNNLRQVDYKITKRTKKLRRTVVDKNVFYKDGKKTATKDNKNYIIDYRN